MAKEEKKDVKFVSSDPYKTPTAKDGMELHVTKSPQQVGFDKEPKKGPSVQP